MIGSLILLFHSVVLFMGERKCVAQCAMEENKIYWQANDSFDWLGDDPALYEYELASKKEETLKGKSIAAAFVASLPKATMGALKATLVATLLVIVIMRLLGREIVHVFGVSIFMWAVILAVSVAAYMGSARLIKLVMRKAELHPQWSLTELPGYLEATLEPVRVLSVVILGGSLWMTFIPSDCTSFIGRTPLDICYYEYAHRFIYAVGLVAFGFMLEKIAMQSIRSRFHRQTYGLRLVQVRFKRFVVDRLAQVASVLAREQQQQASSSPKNPLLRDTGGNFKMHQPLSFTAFDTLAYDTTLASDLDAKKVARDIFYALCPSEQKYLTAEDLCLFGSGESNAEAFAVFDADGDGTVTRSEFRNAVVAIFAETRNLARSIVDGDSALDKLDRILRSALLVMLGFLLLAVFKLPAQSILSLGLSTAIALNVFIGDSIKKVFENIIFIFLHHPYDVGDSVILNSNREDPLVVKKVYLANTQFQRWNGEVLIIANNVLYGMHVVNLSRSHESWERIDFVVPLDKATPDAIYAVRTSIYAWLSQAEAMSGFYRNCEIKLLPREESEGVAMAVKVRMKPTNDSVKRWQRRLMFKQFMERQLGPLDGKLL